MRWLLALFLLGGIVWADNIQPPPKTPDQVQGQIQKETIAPAPVSDPLAPQWSEFYTTYHIYYKGLFSGGKNDQAQEDTANYWARRKLTFENEIKGCQSLSTDKMACYMQVRQIENQKTADYKNQINQALQIDATNNQTRQLRENRPLPPLIPQ